MRFKNPFKMFPITVFKSGGFGTLQIPTLQITFDHSSLQYKLIYMQ